MPTTLPGSFASAAAAGSNPDSSARSSSRADAGSLNEWPRRSNGATQTFRRTSTANVMSSPSTPAAHSLQRDQQSQIPASTGAYVPPHSSTRAGSFLDTRYSKHQLLDLFRVLKDSGNLDDSLPDLYVGDSPLDLSNGGAASKWSRKDDQKSEYSAPGPDVCWERSGTSEPFALSDMTEEEKELFATSVNSPLKASNQAGARESGQREAPLHRKSSLSQAPSTSYSYGLTSPTTTRSAVRRRDTSDSFAFSKDLAASPTSTAPAKDDLAESSPFGLFRRKTDVAETSVDRSIDEELGRDGTEAGLATISSPFASIRRSASNMAVGSSSDGPSNWPPQSPSAIGSGSAFGNLSRPNANLGQNPKRPELGPSRESRFRGLMNIGKTEEEAPELPESTSLKDSTSNTDNPRDTPGSDEDNARVLSRSGPSANLNNQTIADDSNALRALSSLGGFNDQIYRDPNPSIAQPGLYNQTGPHSNEPLSPTFTNPYTSPQQQNPSLHDLAQNDFDSSALHLPGLGAYQSRSPGDIPAPTSFAARRERNRTTSYDQRPSERSQLLGGSAGANKAFPSLTGLGGLGGFGSPEPWSAGFAPPQSAREKSSFPDFGTQNLGSSSAIQSPNLSGPPGGAPFADPGAFGRGTKLGSIFPSAMQEQMRGEQTRTQRDDSGLQSGLEPSDDATRTPGARRDLDSPFRQARGKFDEFQGASEIPQGYRGTEPTNTGDQSANPGGPASSQVPNYALSQTPYSNQHPGQRNASISISTSSQPPAAQQKTMVMPDRIRWIYRDPQGNTQGPWSGLEMHDWYRAGFFSPELLVKKVEDADYEPLAQLIRRIGNSREPFLVPQIGIPGPPSTQAGPGWPNQNVISSPQNPSAAVQPPFAGSFPSFGTTLTAEQQNALERRKQEEQYLMARQKEHLAQQQLHARQLQGQHGMFPQQLQHHSSAQSLQSQPSYGSMTSPNGFQASPPQNINHINPNVSSGFEGPFRLGGGVGIGPIGSGMENLGHIREESSSGYFGRYNTEQSSASQYAMEPQIKDLSLEERTSAMLADRARLERQQAENDRLAQLRSQEQRQEQREPVVNERLREFQEMRSQMEEEVLQNQSQTFSESLASSDDAAITKSQDESLGARNLSLTEQVQKAASSKQSSASSPWAKVDAAVAESGIPQSSSPLPAPAARRGRSNVADTLTAESIAQSESPAEDTPTASIAPWAKDSSETQKQPSLREIQEIEARKAAKQEEVAAAARRAALEREMANQPQPSAPALPSSSTWGSVESPLPPSGSGSSAWSKPSSTKTAAAPPAATKKTLQQIQAEEEAAARKKKASAASNASIASHIAGQVQSMSSGKRYADLAGKAASPSPTTVAGAAVGGAWTTVGASGKAKAPPAATAAAPSSITASSTPRTSSGTNLVGAGNTASTAARPKPTTVNSKQSLATAKQTALEEFKKWATAELQPDLHKNINVDEFVQTLLNFPLDTDMITEVVHQNSSTIDSRHFAEEFMRRRNLAEKGKMDNSGVSGSGTPSSQLGQGAGADGKGSSGGWNEVARKGGANSGNNSNSEGSGAFKIVTAKKKGKR